MQSMNSVAMIELEALSQRFRQFAASECRTSSPLYEHLSLSIAKDQEILALAAHCRKGQPAPNLFLAAVHCLLLQGTGAPLAAFYPDLLQPAARIEDAYPLFREYCLAHHAAILDIITARLVQTNEIRRCSYLSPAFSLIAAQVHHQPLALVEVGTSAGLNLMWDAYGYCYNDGHNVVQAGSASSPVQIQSFVRGDNRLKIPPAFPQIASRTGIDLNIIDLKNEADLLWLRALIWPEQEERVRLLQSAIPLIQGAPLKLLSGEAVTLLPQVLEEASPDTALVIFHTHTINQFSQEASEQLTAVIECASAQRAIFRLANDMGGGGPDYSTLKLMEFRKGKHQTRDLAHVDGHGRWLEWLAD